MLCCLDNEDTGLIVNALEMRSVKAEEVILTQGEEGDCLYLVDSGTLICTRTSVSILCSFIGRKCRAPNH